MDIPEGMLQNSPKLRVSITNVTGCWTKFEEQNFDKIKVVKASVMFSMETPAAVKLDAVCYIANNFCG